VVAECNDFPQRHPGASRPKRARCERARSCHRRASGAGGRRRRAWNVCVRPHRRYRYSVSLGRLAIRRRSDRGARRIEPLPTSRARQCRTTGRQWLTEERSQAERERDAGSIIVALATDAPMSAGDVARLLRRAQNGLARTGSSTSHYSGEIVIGFTTSGSIQHADDGYARQTAVLSGESRVLDPLFQAVTEGTEEAVLNSLFSCRDRRRTQRRALRRPSQRTLPDLTDRPLGP
jgi:hypothetical protein